MTTDLRERFERAWTDEPPLPPVTDRVAAGHRALRRRRTVAAAVVSSTAVAVVAVVAVLVPGSDRGTAPRGVDLAPAPTTSAGPAELPVKAWPYAGQGVDAMALWGSEDGRTLYRSAAAVRAVPDAPAAPIRDVQHDGEVVGHAQTYRVSWRGRTERWYVQRVGGVIKGMGSGTLPDKPLYYRADATSFEIFTDPVGITPEGRLDPKPGAVVSRRSLAGVYDEDRFATMPEVGVVDYYGTRYHAMVGYQPDEHDVIVAEVAPPDRTLTQWVHDIDRRMRSGERLG